MVSHTSIQNIQTMVANSPSSSLACRFLERFQYGLQMWQAHPRVTIQAVVACGKVAQRHLNYIFYTLLVLDYTPSSATLYAAPPFTPTISSAISEVCCCGRVSEGRKAWQNRRSRHRSLQFQDSASTQRAGIGRDWRCRWS